MTSLLEDLGLDLSDVSSRPVRGTWRDETTYTLRDVCDLRRISRELGDDHTLAVVVTVVRRMYNETQQGATISPSGLVAPRLPFGTQMPLHIRLALESGDLSLVSGTTMPTSVLLDVAARLAWLAPAPEADADSDDVFDIDGDPADPDFDGEEPDAHYADGADNVNSSGSDF